ncbi:MAG TPA: hypothetical protein VM821_06060 [Abditibacteriaceae bacterium]|nr:hypothetical protein [Abditibacteriaceae bacterium]
MIRRLPRRFARSLMVLNAPVVAAFVIPATAVVALNAGTTAAHAQILSAAAVQSAVVLDFDVAPGIDPVLGRKAADSVAVEMKSSGDFDVVPRQRVEELVSTIPGLQAPYTPPTARRLGEAAGASVVVTGRVVGATIVRGLNNARTARIQLEMRQMDVRTGDFVNGAQPSAITIDQFQELDDDVLSDQSLDKASYDGVRQMRLYVPAEATITHNLVNDVQMNRGLRDGVRTGQRYSILRDHYNPARRIVERIKIAEVRIAGVDTFQASAIIVDGGSVGIRTGDKARRIYASGIPFTEPAAEPFVKRRRKRN